jgi:hypothetical protein
VTDLRKLSQQQEQRVAKLIGGSVNAGSGSGWKRKNDVRGPGMLWELKLTGKKQITIKLQDLEDLRKHAILDGLLPVFGIQFAGSNRNYVLLDEADFLEMTSD